jgi:hypothetical protein
MGQYFLLFMDAPALPTREPYFRDRGHTGGRENTVHPIYRYQVHVNNFSNSVRVLIACCQIFRCCALFFLLRYGV